MRILHYIPAVRADNLVSDYVKVLATAMKDMAGVQIVTEKDDVAKIIAESKPDIVHVHACWNYGAAKVVKTVCREGIALIVSPHYGLEPYTMRHERHIAKLLKRAAYQRKMICRADALMAESSWEYDNLMALGWKKRVCMVSSSLLDSRITAMRMAEDVLRFYGKVLDTRYFLRMSGLEKEAFCSLLHVSMNRDVHRTQLSGEHLLTLRTLKYEQWRRLLMYADDEGVRPLIDKAVCLIQADVPEIDTSAIDRYHTPHPKDTGGLERKVLLDCGESIKERLDYEIGAGEDVIETICIMTLNVRHHLREKTLSMRHIADLYDIIRYGEYDEDRLAEVLGRLRVKRLAARFLQLLKEYCYLTEGFMPFEPVDDKRTGRIREIILH